MHDDDRVTSAMQSAVAALRPLADAVFNDNGDMTVILPVVSSEDCISAYFARKRLRVALSALVEDQPVAVKEYSHDDRIALAGCLSWDLNEISPRDVAGILDRLSAEGYRLTRGSALASAPAGEDAWQPIETAPKDGTVIDVWVSHPDHALGGYRCSNAIWKRGEWSAERGFPIEGYTLAESGVPLIRVTHWRPLLAPPALSRKGSDAQTVGGGMATDTEAPEADVMGPTGHATPDFIADYFDKTADERDQIAEHFNPDLTDYMREAARLLRKAYVPVCGSTEQ